MSTSIDISKCQSWNLVVGVDVGGTNTDGVLMLGEKVLAWTKTATTRDVTSGVQQCLLNLLESFTSENPGLALDQLASRIRRVCIGTTHFINAVVERRQADLSKVVVVRLCSSASRDTPPFCDFPPSLARCMKAKEPSHYFEDGGYEFNAEESNPVNTDRLRALGSELRDRNINHVVISGIFSILSGCAQQEVDAARIIGQAHPDASITLSHKVGRMGLLERENAAVLNESLKCLSRRTIHALSAALAGVGLHCPLYLTQNNGTLISAAEACQLPVLTFSCGATNSIRGAHFLSKLMNAIVFDVGGTTTDAGFILNGYPRQASSEIQIVGLSVGFRFPDTINEGLGGGTKIQVADDGTVLSFGPQSVGYKLDSEEGALVFGGNTLTFSDIAIAAGFAEPMRQHIDASRPVPCSERLANIRQVTIDGSMAKVRDMISGLADVMKGSLDEVDIVLVGGGGDLLDTSDAGKPSGVARFVKPPHGQVANAVGAAIGQLSFAIDEIYSLPSNDSELRAEKHEEYRDRARQGLLSMRVHADSITVHPLVERTLGYMPGFWFRVQVLAVGDIDDTQPPPQLPALAEAELAAAASTPQGDAPEQAIPPDAEDAMFTSAPDFSPRQYDSQGMWILSVYDVWCIVIGAGILGCGGGGSPSLAKIQCLRALRKGLTIRIVDPDRIGSCPELTGRIANVAYMGAPDVVKEKLVAGTELKASLCAVHKLLNREANDGIVEEELEGGTKIITSGLDKLCRPDSVPAAWSQLRETRLKGEQPLVALMPLEVGGLNCVVPLVLAAELGIPVVNCDGMGRAFPQLDMFVPFIHDVDSCPCVLVAPDGRWRACTRIPNAPELERVLREAVGTFGCIGSLSCSPLRQEDLQYCVPGSISRSYDLGHAVLAARRAHTNPVDAICQVGNAVLVARGRITDYNVRVAQGFALGDITVHPFEDAGAGDARYRIDIQNEYICCFKVSGGKSQAVATVPHLVTLVDNKTGYPITTEELQPGLRVAILALRAPDLLLSDKALQFVGPQHFMKGDQYAGIQEPVYPQP